MKPSHFTTPRTLGECHFAMNADPIERYETPKNKSSWLVGVVILALIVALALV